MKIDFKKMFIVGMELGEPHIKEVVKLYEAITKHGYMVLLNQKTEIKKVESCIGEMVENGVGTIIFATFKHYELAKETAKKYKKAKVIVVSSILKDFKKIERDDALYYVNKNDKSHNVIANIVNEVV